MMRMPRWRPILSGTPVKRDNRKKGWSVDRERFDALARLFATTGSRRSALGTLISVGILGVIPGAEAKHKKTGKGRGKGAHAKGRDKHHHDQGHDQSSTRAQAGDQTDVQPLTDQSVEPAPEVQAEGQGGGQAKHTGKGKRHGKGKGKGKSKGKGQTQRSQPQSARSEATTCCSGGNCTPGPGKNLTKCCYEDGMLAGANFKGVNLTSANFARATLTNANFAAANVSKACFVDADITGASFKSAHTTGAIYCRTTTSSGVNNSGCDKGTSCCPTCDDAHPCGSGKVCCDGRCLTGDCCDNNAQSTCDAGKLCCSRTCIEGTCCRVADCANELCQRKACNGNDCVYTPVTGPSPNSLCSATCCGGACCDRGQVCDTRPNPDVCCTPDSDDKTCAVGTANPKCGTVTNNCGQTVDCGPCGERLCQTGTCNDATDTCSYSPVNDGQPGPGCAGPKFCCDGDECCQQGDVCLANGCCTPESKDTTCGTGPGKKCGTVTNNCGQTVDCGDCAILTCQNGACSGPNNTCTYTPVFGAIGPQCTTTVCCKDANGRPTCCPAGTTTCDAVTGLCGCLGNDCGQGKICCNGTCFANTKCCNGSSSTCPDPGTCKVKGCDGQGNCAPQNAPANTTCTTGAGTGICCGGDCKVKDDTNCGACGTVCPTNASCNGTSCVCDQGFKPCNGQCIHNAECCGDCAGNETCLNGNCCLNANVCGNVCLDTPCDTANCDVCDPGTGTCKSNCQQPTNPCLDSTCISGVCGTANKLPNTICSGPGGRGVCCDGVCHVDDIQNCTRCGQTCPAGGTCKVAICDDRVCGTKNAADDTGCTGPDGAGVCCDGTCQVDDILNCTGCGEACPTQICQVTTCSDMTCGLTPVTGSQAENCNADGFLCCDGGCVDTETDNANCGTCGTTCGGGTTCVAGACVCNTPTDCQQPTNPCLVATCTSGVCGTAQAADNTTCSLGSGQEGICVNGGCASSICAGACTQDAECSGTPDCYCNRAEGTCFACTRDCAGKVCGPDGCGGVCGPGCVFGANCVSNGTACITEPPPCDPICA
jgi:hypothetical protein